ncbi:tRNA adenosine(34) deaminase TadA [Neptunomonas qingdaonensis]|nr:tRNA adenosine(34) deaminase TadA [Neptunomonas qingdaonensis]
MEKTDQDWMSEALLLADRAAELGEVPVGAVVVLEGEIIGRGWNQPISKNDPTAHAEIMALRDAAANVGNYRVVNADLYVTLEPCSMCAGAMVHARVRRVIFGAYEPKAGVIVSRQSFLQQPWLNHQVEYTAGILSDTCSAKLSQFFKQRREQKRRDKNEEL